MSTLKEMLESTVQTGMLYQRTLGNRNSGLSFWLLHRYVLERGQEWETQTLPARYGYGTPNYCFHNAFQLTRRFRSLRYCEGYVSSPTLPFPVHHAWCIDKDNKVVDITIREPEEREYIGVIIDKETYRWWTQGTNSCSVFVGKFESYNLGYLLYTFPDLIPPDLMTGAIRELVKHQLDEKGLPCPDLPISSVSATPAITNCPGHPGSSEAGQQLSNT